MEDFELVIIYVWYTHCTVFALKNGRFMNEFLVVFHSQYHHLRQIYIIWKLSPQIQVYTMYTCTL